MFGEKFLTLFCNSFVARAERSKIRRGAVFYFRGGLDIFCEFLSGLFCFAFSVGEGKEGRKSVLSYFSILINLFSKILGTCVFVLI